MKKNKFLKFATIVIAITLMACTPPSSNGSTGSDSIEYTIEQYNDLKTGLNYAQVSEIMGDDGVQVSESNFDGIIYADYSWDNANGSSVMVSFVADALESKVQAGLK